MSRSVFILGIILGIIILLISSPIFGQELRQLHFVVTNSENKQAISYAKVSNRTYNKTFITNEKGELHIKFKDYSLVKISAIGYQDYYLTISNNNNFIKVNLVPRIYELDEFCLMPFPTLIMFKKAFLDLDLPDSSAISLNLSPITGWQKYQRKLSDYTTENVIRFSFTSPISGLYNIFSQQAKSAQKYQALMLHDWRQQRFDKKYNAALVKKITQIKQKEELAKMMKYCNPSYDFIMEASEYEIAIYINKCYLQFLERE